MKALGGLPPPPTDHGRCRVLCLISGATAPWEAADPQEWIGDTGPIEGRASVCSPLNFLMSVPSHASVLVH